MHLKVLACDLDGTLAENGEVANETWTALHRAKADGLTLILVTGRILNTFSAEGPYAELCDAIVAENGAIVYFPRHDRVESPFGHVSATVINHLARLAVPLERGTAIVSTHVPHDEAVLQVLREMGGGATVEYNRGAVMVLPPGATKGTGLRYALHELGYSARNVVACGDAENDRSLFEVVELAAAVANAVPDIQDLADVVLPYENGAGVRWLLNELLAGRFPPQRRLNPEHRLLLGHRIDGTPVHLDPFALIDGNLGIFGASGSGKSWLAGLLAEELLKKGYQTCIIDPEGDYRGLRAFPHSLILGGEQTHLPPVVDVVTLCEYSDVNLVLDLSLFSVDKRHAYVLDLLRALQSLRRQRGRPQWLLIDEIQSFCLAEATELTALIVEMMQVGGITLVSYRPSQVALPLLEALDHWLLTRLSLPEEIAVLKPFWASQNEQNTTLANLPTLPLGQAHLSFHNERWRQIPSEGVVTFHIGPRAIPHIRHLHKYLRAPLPESKRFYFYSGSNHSLGRAAASLWEFCEALKDLPVDSLRYHLQRDDFERWLRDVIHDDELARRVRKISRRDLNGAALRQALSDVVKTRFEELESLA